MIKHDPDMSNVGGEIDAEVDFQDARGDITNLFLDGIRSISELTSKEGSIRANHYHKTDWHYTYVVSGTVHYFERAVGAAEVPEPETFQDGQIFFTPPNREHAMLFGEDSVILTFARNLRDHDSHEGDVVRVTFVTEEIAKKYV